MAVRAGDLRRRLDIQQRSTTIDSTGGQSTTWTTITTVWACIEGLQGREPMAAQQVNEAVTAKITIRYQTQFADPKVVAAMRGVETKDGVTRIFNFQGVHDDEEQRRFLIIDAEEGLNDG